LRRPRRQCAWEYAMAAAQRAAMIHSEIDNTIGTIGPCASIWIRWMLAESWVISLAREWYQQIFRIWVVDFLRPRFMHYLIQLTMPKSNFYTCIIYNICNFNN
jgi:hypothetical protein